MAFVLKDKSINSTECTFLAAMDHEHVSLQDCGTIVTIVAQIALKVPAIITLSIPDHDHSTTKTNDHDFDFQNPSKIPKL